MAAGSRPVSYSGAMRAILVLNNKGGSGKSTLATNLAAHYAGRGRRVALVDLDPQGSSTKWLEVRPPDRPLVVGVAGWREPLRVPPETEVAVIDVPAGIRGRRLREALRLAPTVVMPVLPSPLDVHAARAMVQEVQGLGALRPRPLAAGSAWSAWLGGLAGAPVRPRLASVANRVREHTMAYDALYTFLDKLRVPYLTSLRDSQNYIHAMAKGLSIFELPKAQVRRDLEQWTPLLRWLDGRASQPRPV